MWSKLSSQSFLGNFDNFLYKKMWIYNFTVTIVSQKISRTFFVRNLIAYKTYVREKIFSQKFSCNCFSKISRTFYASRKLWIIVVFLLHTLKEKLPIFLINTLLLHIPLLALTDRWSYRETNTLAMCALEEPFFQLCCCVSFLFWREIGFGSTYYFVFRVQ
jgi:hypothetical protein